MLTSSSSEQGTAVMKATFWACLVLTCYLKRFRRKLPKMRVTRTLHFLKKMLRAGSSYLQAAATKQLLSLVRVLRVP